jgi:O-glycosyl hydrolase
MAIVCWNAPVSARSITFAEVAADQAAQSDADGWILLRATTSFGVGSSYFGVTGGLNSVAIDDADGKVPADESIEFQFTEESGLSGLDVVWTRAMVTLTGFTEDPQGDTGTYDAATGTWSVWQPWTGGSTARYRFSNTRASSGRTITLSALDPDLSGPQISITAVHFEQAGAVPPDAVLLADTATVRQVIEHFGASMFWTIDPTVSWPVETKEALALKLMSEAGGIGLSNLRFDFGGGDTGTGNQTREPYTWRFPAPMKAGPSSAYDWSRREGQQWFLRRARDMAVENLTLGSLSAPHWMTKTGRTFCSGSIGTTNLDRSRRDDYAGYLTDVMVHFRDTEGITFDHVSPVNEPEWDWESGSQEGDRATASDISALATALHLRMRTAGLHATTRILVGEHAQANPLLDDGYHQQYSGNNWNGGNNAAGYGKYREYLNDLFGNPSLTGKLAPVAAYHSYFTDDPVTLGSNLRSLLAQNAADRGIGLIQSEYCILGPYGSGRDLQFEPAKHVFRVIHKDLTVAGVLGWSWWLALSPHDYKDGLIYTDFDRMSAGNPRLFESKVMWVLGNFSRFIRPGYRRIGSGGYDDMGGLMSSSWLSPDEREVVIVAANFSDEPLVVNLPEGLSGQPGVFHSWDRWITDRGRNLRREPAVAAQTTLPPQSVTTFAGSLSQSPFRLTVALSQSPGNPRQVTARATYENGVFILPSIDSSTRWVFQPSTSEPGGDLPDGRHYIRRMADGFYLTISSGDQISLQALHSRANAWDVETCTGGLRLTHPGTGRVLTQNASGVVVRRAGKSTIPATRVDYSANYQWSDNLGAGPVITLTPGVDRWVQVKAMLGTDRATKRLRVGGKATGHTSGGMPAEIISRPGKPVMLTAAPEDIDRPWRFRLVPSDRDAVIASTSTAALTTKLPVGEDREQWECVEPGDGRVWLQAEAGRKCWIRSITSGLCLKPSNDGLSPGSAVVQTAADGPASEWTIDSVDASRFRIRHPLSGLVLNISGTTGLPILWSDSTAENSRFHLDPVEEDPLILAWSHDLGKSVNPTVSPASTVTYTLNATRGGANIAARTTVIVSETFEEWSKRWFGAGTTPAPGGDDDADGQTNLLEYALGSDPLVHDPTAALLTDNAGNLEIAWPKGREALGTWKIEWSSDLIVWTTDTNPAILVEDGEKRIAARIARTAGRIFVRLRFTPASSV